MFLQRSHSARKPIQVTAFIFVALLAASPCLAGPKVPLKSELKARVGQFYAAYARQDWSQLRDLMAPFVRECSSADDIREGWTEDGLVKVLSWKIVNIQYDSSYLGQEFKVECTGQVYQPNAGAVVTISQRDQMPEAQPERGDHYLHWVLIGESWFTVGPE